MSSVNGENMKEHPYKKLDFKEEDLKINKLFISSRYSITSLIDCENLYSFSKENEFSFFNLCVAAIYKTIESIPELKTFVLYGEGREYEHINIVLPLINEENNVGNICIESIDDFASFKEWDDFLQNIKQNPKNHQYVYGPESQNHVFAILSCLPWIHYTNFNDMTLASNNFIPVVHWGKYENGKLPVTISINHIFVFGYHLGLFFNILSNYMENPNSIFPNIE